MKIIYIRIFATLMAISTLAFVLAGNWGSAMYAGASACWLMLWLDDAKELESLRERDLDFPETNNFQKRGT